MEPCKDTNPKDAIAGTKAPLALVSPVAMVHWAIAHAVGMTKYGAWNWRIAGVRSSVYLHAIVRHFLRYVSGEEFDPVDGQHHLGAIMACCAIILDAKEAGKLTDDRPPSVNIGPLLEWAEAVMKQLQATYADKTPKHCTIQDTEKKT